MDAGGEAEANADATGAPTQAADGISMTASLQEARAA